MSIPVEKKMGRLSVDTVIQDRVEKDAPAGVLEASGGRVYVCTSTSPLTEIRPLVD